MSSFEEGRDLIAAGNDKRIDEKMELVRHLQKEAFQLANYYFVFQGVIFTAFYNTPSNLKCRFHWIPFTLSLVAGVLNLCALSTIALKYKRTLDTIDIDVIRVTRAPRVNTDNLPVPTGTEMHDPSRSAIHVNTGEPFAIRIARHWRTTYVVVCLLLFLVFFVVTLIGSLTLTCNIILTAATPPL